MIHCFSFCVLNITLPLRHLCGFKLNLKMRLNNGVIFASVYLICSLSFGDQTCHHLFCHSSAHVSVRQLLGKHTSLQHTPIRQTSQGGVLLHCTRTASWTESYYPWCFLSSRRWGEGHPWSLCHWTGDTSESSLSPVMSLEHRESKKRSPAVRLAQTHIPRPPDMTFHPSGSSSFYSFLYIVLRPSFFLPQGQTEHLEFIISYGRSYKQWEMRGREMKRREQKKMSNGLTK